MSTHRKELLGAYVLGVLDGDEWSVVEAHLVECVPCRREVDDLREMEAALGEIPPEAFLDGPPPGGDLLLRRTLDQVRGESRRRDRRRRTVWAAAAVVAAVVALGAGIVVGRTVIPASASPVAGTRSVTATDPVTGASLSVEVQPAAGWVRVHAAVGGVQAGEKCRLYVVAHDGLREQAGSWVVGESAGAGTIVDGAALIAPADVDSVQVETYAGLVLVAVAV
jgi:anti-sigma factor RsiW